MPSRRLRASIAVIPMAPFASRMVYVIAPFPVENNAVR
jgi:hypothetical protein